MALKPLYIYNRGVDNKGSGYIIKSKVVHNLY